LSLPETFRIGDHVCVGGTKAGIVAFVGEVHFSSGEWAGVILDSPVGKNDGSVAGQRYFSCQANHGIFARPNKLTRIPVEPLAQTTGNTQTSDGHAVLADNLVSGLSADSKSARTSAAKTVDESVSDAGLVQRTAGGKISVIPLPRRTSVGSNHSGYGSGLQIAPGMSTSLSDASCFVSNESGTRLHVGSRVTVSGSKNGTVRYMGPTEFAHGTWVGIELDDALGKNDGSVGNKRQVNLHM
jgi:CAP-Gly domain-containing linker protein 1